MCHPETQAVLHWRVRTRINLGLCHLEDVKGECLAGQIDASEKKRLSLLPDVLNVALINCSELLRGLTFRVETPYGRQGDG